MAIEILDSGSVKVLALVTFAAADVLPTVVGRGIRSFEGNGAFVQMVPIDPLPPTAVVFVSLVNGEDGRFLEIETDASEDPEDPGEIELQQLGLDGEPLADVATWAVLVIHPSQMGEVAGTLQSLA